MTSDDMFNVLIAVVVGVLLAVLLNVWADTHPLKDPCITRYAPAPPACQIHTERGETR